MTFLEQARAITLLKDAAFMLSDIEKARELPAYGQVWKQYVALGKEISEFIREVQL